MKKVLLAFIFFCSLFIPLIAQVGVSTDNSSPAPSAMLEVKSSTKGLLPPRMTFAQRNAIPNPAEGLTVICVNCTAEGTGCVSIFLGDQWLNLAGSCDLPVSPQEGIHLQSNTWILWKWNPVPIAIGYKWNTTNNYATSINLGTDLARLEDGFTTGNSYTRYVWAYNACGYSQPTILNAQALNCGSSFTVNHVAGSVAPISKTVTYGTVTNIPGETSKCWITRNLGATMQPNTVSDNSEAAAGWYWQFNLKQGYKHDGTTRTPNTTWITNINENSEWTADNDPCSILLGSAWRIPTLIEWANVVTGGSWTNWNGPFSSGLQMHAAGCLWGNGSLGSRGFTGEYYSSKQYNDTKGWMLLFGSNYIGWSDTELKEKADAVRCIRE